MPKINPAIKQMIFDSRTHRLFQSDNTHIKISHNCRSVIWILLYYKFNVLLP